MIWNILLTEGASRSQEVAIQYILVRLPVFGRSGSFMSFFSGTFDMLIQVNLTVYVINLLFPQN